MCLSAGDDFIQISGVPISFSVNQYRVCFPVPIIDDDEYEGVTENFTAVIASIPVGIMLGEPDTAIISIVDNDSEIHMFVCVIEVQ